MAKDRFIMRMRYVVILILAASHVGGCAFFEKFWRRMPWHKDKPVATPEAVGKGGEPTTQPVASAPSPSEPLRPAPAFPRPAPAKPQPPAPPAPRPGATEVVAARSLQVNSEYFTVEDALQRARRDLRKLSTEMPRSTFSMKVDQVLSDTVRHMIIEVLVLAEANKNMPEALTKQVDHRLDEELQRMIQDVGGGSRKKLEHVLLNDGTTLKKMLARRRKEITMQEYLRARFIPSIQINRQMLLDYYREHRSDFVKDKQVQMQIILSPFSAFLAEGARRPTVQEREAARAQARRQIDQAVTRLENGSDFADVARQLSKGPKAKAGGVWPMMPAGSFRYTKAEDVAFALNEGQISTPVECEDGFRIVKVKKVRPGKTVSFEDAQPEIDLILRERQYRKLTEELFRELMNKATVTMPREYISDVNREAMSLYWKEPLDKGGKEG